MEGRSYLNEVCLSIKSCDAILNCPVLVAICQVFLLDAFKTPTPMKTAGTPADETLNEPTTLPFITSNILPLLYVNTHRLRLFIPQMHSKKSHSMNTKLKTENTSAALGDTLNTASGLLFTSSQMNAQPLDDTAEDITNSFCDVTDDIFVCEVRHKH